MKDYIQEILDHDLITMLDEIYDWKKTGDLKQDGKFKKYFNEHQEDYMMIMYLEDDILFEAQQRYDKVVKVLFCKYPNLYIR